MYIKRALEKSFKASSIKYPILLLEGAKGTGKTSFLKKLNKNKRNYVSLEPLDIRQLAWEDPELFLCKYQSPLIIDEIQLAPNLIKYIAEKANKDKDFSCWISASQSFSIKKELTLLNNKLKTFTLYPLSNKEINKINSEPFIPNNINTANIPEKNPQEIFKQIWLGSFPEVVIKKNKTEFYQNYVQNYIEKEIYEIAQIGDKSRFFAFMKAVAARSAKMLNYAELAEEACISQPTAKSYLKILEISGLIKLIYPYKTISSAPMVSTPKVYMTDTGLMSYLTSWNNPEALADGAESKSFFETKYVSEIIKSFTNSGLEPELYYYRDRTTSPKEISLIIKNNDIIYPVEFKKSITVNSEASRNFEKLKTFKTPIGTGAIICLAKEYSELNKGVKVIPAYMI